MKFYLITIITMLFMAVSTVSAQNINIGTKIGLNSYTINSDNNSDFDSRIGIHAGLLGHIHLNSQFALQPEIVYSMQGAKSGNNELKLDYINVPVIIQYMFDNGFRFQAGPQLGLLVNAKAEHNNSSNDIKDDFKSVDAGLSFGVGYVHPPTDFGIDLRYNLGLNDISESSNVESTNRGFQIGVFYLFNHN
ncbi:MAG: porin family protein [Balneolaceae bacterium]|nr:porin family protein [Balneolaceae bacterium]